MYLQVSVQKRERDRALNAYFITKQRSQNNNNERQSKANRIWSTSHSIYITRFLSLLFVSGFVELVPGFLELVGSERERELGKNC